VLCPVDQCVCITMDEGSAHFLRADKPRSDRGELEHAWGGGIKANVRCLANAGRRSRGASIAVTRKTEPVAR
jgi:hypothetical protein